MIRSALAVAALILCGPVAAAPTAEQRPPDVNVHKSRDGPTYADKRGKTLYVLSARGAQSRAGKVSNYCTGACLQIWTPVSAAADAKPLGEWTIIDAPQGKQWAYQRNPVFTFNADKKAGDRKGDSYDDLWSVIAYVPPKPAFLAPPSVDAKLVGDGYVLTDAQGHALSVDAGKTPFVAAMASLPIGDWTILREGDAAQWAWRGKPVYVNEENILVGLPANAKLIRP